jgi:acyl carrier protein
MDPVYSKLSEIFREIFADDTLVLQPQLTAADIKGWDSLKQIDILIAVQERFAIRVNSREIDRLNCIGDIVDVIRRKQGL